jgi:hypothetical protein
MPPSESPYLITSAVAAAAVVFFFKTVWPL